MKTAVRRVLLLSALMSPTALYALGLGEIRLNSALNQPFDAEIELVSAAQEDLAALRASLASSDTFLRYGLDKPAYLADFTFRVVRSGGKDVLKITSPRPVTEPFVTLLVEANWPRGRLLREYTVLLDPPVFAPAPVAAEAPVATPRATSTARTPAPARIDEVAPPPSSTASEPVVRRPAAALSAEAGGTYRVQPNDTLWEIASAAYPGGRSDVNRAMVAIYQANPAAFAGNINLLRAGSELRMPASGDVAAISASAAADEVARQYKLWREGASAAPAAATDGGRLRLVTPEQGSAAPSTATQPAATAADSAELSARVQQLEAELAEARRLLEVRNAELATLQGGTAPIAEPTAPVDGAAPPADGGEAAVPAEPAAPLTEPQPQPEPEAVAQAEPEPKPRSVPAAEEPAPSLFDRLRDYWWALLALLVAALGIAAFMRRRQSSGSTETDLEEALARPAGDLRGRPTISPKEPSILVEERKPVDVVAPGAGAAAAAAVQRAPEPSRKATIEDTLSGEGPVNIEAGDPLAEADFHMAYGLYDQAADLVQVAAKREPQRRDLKLKLLEIFFVWGNKDRFLEVAREMAGSRADAQPGEWDKVLIMGRQLAPEDPLFAAAGRGASASIDMELDAADTPLDMELAETKVGSFPDLDLTGTAPRIEDAEGGLDFVLDEPVRGSEDESTVAPTIEMTRPRRVVSEEATVEMTRPISVVSEEPTIETPRPTRAASEEPTIETPRLRPASGDEPTTEVPIEDLGLAVGEIEGLDDLADLEQEPTQKNQVIVEDTVERPAIARSPEPEEDLLSSTSITRIIGPDEFAKAADEQEAGVIDLSDSTGVLPSLDEGKLEVTGLMPKPEFGLDAEAATMSEVGTKLDLARAYIDMGDPEGARSILDEVLKEGSPNQRKEAERLLAGLP